MRIFAFLFTLLALCVSATENTSNLSSTFGTYEIAELYGMLDAFDTVMYESIFPGNALFYAMRADLNKAIDKVIKKHGDALDGTKPKPASLWDDVFATAMSHASEENVKNLLEAFRDFGNSNWNALQDWFNQTIQIVKASKATDFEAYLMALSPNGRDTFDLMGELFFKNLLVKTMFLMIPDIGNQKNDFFYLFSCFKLFMPKTFKEVPYYHLLSDDLLVRKANFETLDILDASPDKLFVHSLSGREGGDKTVRFDYSFDASHVLASILDHFQQGRYNVLLSLLKKQSLFLVDFYGDEEIKDLIKQNKLLTSSSEKVKEAMKKLLETPAVAGLIAKGALQKLPEAVKFLAKADEFSAKKIVFFFKNHPEFVDYKKVGEVYDKLEADEIVESIKEEEEVVGDGGAVGTGTNQEKDPLKIGDDGITAVENGGNGDDENKGGDGENKGGDGTNGGSRVSGDTPDDKKNTLKVPDGSASGSSEISFIFIAFFILICLE